MAGMTARWFVRAIVPCVVSAAAMTLSGCGNPEGSESSSSPTAQRPVPDHTMSVPRPQQALPVVTAAEEKTDISLAWGSPETVTTERAVTITVDMPACVTLRGVRFTREKDTVTVAVLGHRASHGASACTERSRTAVARLAWPNGLPPHAQVLHAPTATS
ncbi:hypothetical protein AB0P32_21875 [Streptomyces sp. NPDC085995]|uniref:hypothetical protein n=1 Tax=Streptomyces sp. NPDC085995 TaxID=3154861 RepID=UPI00344A8F6E